MKKYMITLLLSLLIFKLSAQENKVIMKIAGEDVYVADFLRVYEKNNQKEKIDEEDLKKYIELYVVYKLKVKEAISLGLDTIPRFTNELKGYRKQLAKPYLSYSEHDESMMKEAYGHMKEDIRASHILIRLNENPTAADTLEAYEKLMTVKSRAMKGESFADLAVELSEDPSAKDQEGKRGGPAYKGNKGDLGYFTVFDMVYPFEKGAYDTKVGEISNPIRTSFGYHLIKVTDRMPAMGKITVAHILVSVPENSNENDLGKLEARAQDIYKKAIAGDDFLQLAMMYSDDKGSAAKGGELPAFNTNRMVPDFISAIAQLQDTGQITAPVKTTYGWHIIKLLKRTGIKSYEDESKFLKQKIISDSRGKLGRNYAAQQIKKEFKYKEKRKGIKKFSKFIDSTVFLNTWTPEKVTTPDKEMFRIDDYKVTFGDFAKYLQNNQLGSGSGDPIYYTNQLYKKFVDEEIISFKDDRLESLYPDFRYLMQEYHDGILLFDLTEKMVWNKAISDTVGLKNYYELNRDQYKWDTRLEGVIYSCADGKIAKVVKDMIAEGMSVTAIRDSLNKESKLTVFSREGIFLKEDDAVLEKIEWKKGVSEDIRFKQIIKFVHVKDIIAPSNKKLDEAKGIITADYQDKLEKDWLESLRNKYNIEIYDVIEAVKEFKGQE